MNNIYANDAPPRVNYDWIKEAFVIYRRDVWTWILATVIFGVCMTSIQLPFEWAYYKQMFKMLMTHSAFPVAPVQPSLLMFVAYIPGLLLLSYAASYQFKMANMAVRGEKLALSDMLSGARNYLAFLLYTLALSVGYLVSFIVTCICPPFGPIAFFAMLWPGYALVADGSSAGVALQISFNRMKRDFWNAFCMVLLFLLAMIVLELPMLIGYFGLIFSGYSTAVIVLMVVGFAFVLAASLVYAPVLTIIGALAYRDMFPDRPDIIHIAPTGAWPPQPTMPPSTPGQTPPADPPEVTNPDEEHPA